MRCGVSDVDASLAFYGVLGHEVVGQLQVDAGMRLAMLALGQWSACPAMFSPMTRPDTQFPRWEGAK